MIALSFGIFAALCWSLHDLVARRYSAGIGPFRMAFLVMVVGAVALLAPVLWNGTIQNAGRDGIVTAAIMGLVYAAAVAALFKAFSLAPVSVVGPFTAGYPALVVLWNVINGLMPGPLQWLALLLTMGGALVVARSGSRDGGLNAVVPGKVWLVVLASVVASVSFAATVVLGQKAALTLGEFETTFVSRFPAALVLLPFALADQRRELAISPGGWLGVVLMALFDVVAVSAINAAGFFPGAAYSSMGISLYGGLSVFLAMIFLKESVSAGQWLGVAMIVAGIALLGYPG